MSDNDQTDTRKIEIASINQDVLAEIVSGLDNIVRQYEQMSGLRLLKIERDIDTGEYEIYTVTRFSPVRSGGVSG